MRGCEEWLQESGMRECAGIGLCVRESLKVATVKESIGSSVKIPEYMQTYAL